LQKFIISTENLAADAPLTPLHYCDTYQPRISHLLQAEQKLVNFYRPTFFKRYKNYYKI
jgi:hypothetical protein